MQQYFVTALNNEEVVFSAEQEFHLQRVMRCQPKDLVVVAYRGRRYLVELKQVQPKVLGIIKEALPQLRQDLFVSLFAVLLKKEKWEYLLQKAVEFGAGIIVPCYSKHCVVRLAAEDVEKKLRRWNKITLEASEQCHRVTPVIVERPLKIKDVAD